MAVFKPEDEEPLAANNPRGQLRSATGEGLRKGTRVGEGALREVAAFLLDKGHFAGVPPTTFGHLCGDHVRLPSEAEAAPKRGSLQQVMRKHSPRASHLCSGCSSVGKPVTSLQQLVGLPRRRQSPSRPVNF